MVRLRAGRSSLGCLFTLLLLVTAVYFAFQLAEPYWRYYQYVDTIRQAARFSDGTSNATLEKQIHAKADSLGLPPEAYRLRFNRTARTIIISTEYEEEVALPGYTRHYRFQPRVEAPL